MKVLCPQCERLGELEQFRLEGSTLLVTCTKCGAEHRATPAPPASSPTPLPRPSSPSGISRALSLASSPAASNVVMLRTVNTEAVELAAAAAKENPFAVPAGYCPKCLGKKPESAASCPQCGLLFERSDLASVEPSEWLREGWRALLESWGDEKRHEALRVRASTSDELVALGRLYRIRLAVLPDDPYAQRGRDDVLRFASAPVAVRAQQQAEPRKTMQYVALGLLGLAVLSAFVFFIRVMMSSLHP